MSSSLLPLICKLWMRQSQSSTSLLRQIVRNVTTKSSSNTAPNHISVTADRMRHKIMAPATITEIQDLSKSVKLLKVQVQEDRFSFKAGQWIDMFIPGVETVGGFSICSDPDLLNSTRTFHLAIKFAKHPPANWVHTKCQVGDSIVVRAGGDFFYDPVNSDTPSDLLLLGGGVGVNPLYSILLHFVSLSNNNSESTKDSKATLIYSAKSFSDILFREELMKMDDANANVTVKLHCSDEFAAITKAGGHIDQDQIKEAISNLNQSRTNVYICGPSMFINDMESHCQQCGIDKHNIHYEKWW